MSQVAYASGAMADLSSVTAAARRAGALVAWDLSHSAGAVPVDLDDHEVDLAVGCTYKHLFAGPGAPAFLYVARRLQPRLRSPIPGWFGQRQQFAMAPGYEPLDGVGRFAAGTPSILGVVAVDEGVGLVAEAGLARVREKGMALTALIVDLAGEWLAPLGFTLSSPRAADRRGNHVSLAHPDAHRIGAALIAEAGVVPDIRPPDLLRLGPSPLAGRFVEVWDGLARTRDLVAAGRHLAYDATPGRVT
jgi:kynureninase